MKKKIDVDKLIADASPVKLTPLRDVQPRVVRVFFRDAIGDGLTNVSCDRFNILVEETKVTVDDINRRRSFIVPMSNVIYMVIE